MIWLAIAHQPEEKLPVVVVQYSITGGSKLPRTVEACIVARFETEQKASAWLKDQHP